MAGNLYTGTSIYDFKTIAGTSDDFSATTGTTGIIAIGGSKTGSIETAGDLDWFKVTLTAGKNYTFEALGSPTSNGSLTDPYLRLYNSSGTILTQDDDSGIGLNASLNYTAASSGTYYIGASSWGASTGTYTVKASLTSIDSMAPEVISFSPADGTTGVPIGSNISLTFNEAVKAGAGNIYVYNSNGSITKTISVNDASQVSFLGNTITINPSSDLTYNTDYFIKFGSGVVKDSAGNNFAGISDSTTFNFRTEASSSGSFDIDIVYSGNSAYQAYFDQAANLFESIILNDLPSANYLGTTIDDLRINASVVAIDGQGGILGQAGPQQFRSSGSLPYFGIMQFDSSDVASMVSNGTFTDVVVHEMAHVLGFGTLWKGFGLNNTFGQYIGQNALTEYRNISGNAGATYIPLETSGGSGTAESHWSEAIFDREIMTGYAESSGNMPLSRMTIASFADLGYSVDFSYAEAYSSQLANFSQVGLIGTQSPESGVPLLVV